MPHNPITLREAREILGIGPNDDPRPLMGTLRAERENLAALVRDATNDTLAMRYQDDLVRFDQALAAVRETLEALGLEETTTAEPISEEIVAPAEEAEATPRRSWKRVAAVMLFFLISALGTAFWFAWQHHSNQAMEFKAHIASLYSSGNDHIENRRWDEASVVFIEIDRLVPDQPIGRLGLARIEVGIAEEQSQFIGYWTGEARAALDSGRWDDAEAAANKVLERFLDQPDAVAVLDDIAGAKRAEARRSAIATTTGLLERGEIEAALAEALELAKTHAGDEEISELVARTRSAHERMQADLNRANVLFEKARARDTGAFDAEALEWLREAALLAPRDETIAAHLEKMASYTRTIRVPEDEPELEEAMANARKNDRILLGPGTWQGAFVINQPIELQGAGPEETILECPAIAGCALTLGPEALETRVSGITFRHVEFDAGADRYSAVLVRGGSVVFADCHFIDASGHGLAVIEGAKVEIQRCQFRGNGWNGLAVTGEGSKAVVHESNLSGNFAHGVEAWNGGHLSLTQCRIEGNTGNGVHIDTTAPGVRIESSEFVANREYGIVLTAAGDGSLSKNRVHQNLLGGIAIRKAAAGLRVTQNEISSNSGTGLLLDQGLVAASYQENTIQRNAANQITTQAELTPIAPE